MAEPRIVLYRCRTPSNWLCPCGAVERRLRKLDRPEIEELTKQRRVPVLVDGEEVIHDSKRILQWLEHRHGDG
jgi:hypothetical protein